MKIKTIIILVGALIGLILLLSSAFTVRETESVILTQFGRPIGEPITEPGLHFRTPFVQEINRLEKRMLAFDAPATSVQTEEKKFIEVDVFGRWRISDPAVFFVTLTNERRAQSRLEGVIRSAVNNAVASHELIEVVRSNTKREMTESLREQAQSGMLLRPAKRGRLAVLNDALKAAQPVLEPLGIELLDVRIKRVHYDRRVLPSIYQRMKSEREQIAERFRSEGEGERARILGRKEKDLLKIESEAYEKVQGLRGEADAEASRIYAEAYDQTPEAREFYTFLKTLETYRMVLGGSNLVLSTDSPLFGLFKKVR
jgi:membrane protease subunit HflC